jgi:type I restriction enzyme M protein
LPEDAPEAEDYEVFMARIDDIGYDATGRLNVPESEAPEPQEVKERYPF